MKNVRIRYRKKQGAQLPNPLVTEHSVKINDCWRRSTDSLAELALACCAANEQLDAFGKRQLVKELPFGMTTFCKFAMVGADPRLMAAERRHLLPAKMTALYELKHYTDEEFQAFEAEGLLSPRLRRADVIGWRSKRRGEAPKRTGPTLPSVFYAALRPNRHLANSEVSKADAKLTALAEEFEMDVVYPETKSRNGVVERALRQMRRKAKQIVAEDIKHRRKKLGPHALTSRPELQKYAGFLVDEVEIEPDADQDRILHVLKMIGREDEFEPMRNAAYREEYELDVSSEAPAWMDAVADTPPPAAALAEDMEELREQFEASKPKQNWEHFKARSADVK
jgi:hypothetical protein